MNGGQGAECAIGDEGDKSDEGDHAGEEGDPENADDFFCAGGFWHSIRAITSKIGNSRQESEKNRLKNAFFYPVHKRLAEFFADGDLFAADEDVVVADGVEAGDIDDVGVMDPGE